MSSTALTGGQPEWIGRYRVDQVLGRGAMGVIFRAHDPAIGRDVAIKLVRADLLDGEERESYLARFRHEAQAAGRCVHPNIVTIYDFAVHEGNPFIAMEFVDGANLADAIEGGSRFQPNEATSIVLQLLEALACAHRLGVVHRDIKPANILLQRNGQVRVMDFGISRLESSSLTQNGTIIGTPSYMSPEQCRGDEVDQRSDLFSAGIVLHELLSGEKPFPGKSFTEVLSRVLHSDAPDLTDLLGPGGIGLAAIVRRALRKEPAERFATASEMAEAIRDLENRGAAEDRTILVSRAAVAPRLVMGMTLDNEALNTLQERLAQHVGPIAKMLVASAAKQVSTMDLLHETLAGKIPSAAARAEFLRAVQGDAVVRTGRSATASGVMAAGSLSGQSSIGISAPAAPVAIPSELIARAQSELMLLVGPIAKVLVKRALAKAATPEELWAALATHIDAPAERRAFEAKLRT